MSIRWVVFDVVGTLLLPGPSVAAIYHAVGQSHGSRLTVEEIQARFRRAYQKSEFCRELPEEAWDDPTIFRTTEADERCIWSALVASVLDDVCDFQACFSALFARFEDPASWRILPGVESSLSALQKAGYRLTVASNFDSRLNTLLDSFPAFAAIERRAISSEVGYRKPSLHFFRAAEALMQAEPYEILMIGDDVVNDILGSRNAGWNALRLVSENYSSTGADEVGSVAGVHEWLQRQET